MLEPAILYKDRLKEKFAKEITKPKNKYANFGDYYSYELEIDTNEWDRLQRVSVNSKGDIVGYLKAEIDRNSLNISGMHIINFDQKNIIFSKDLKRFFDLIFERGINKINFGVIVGNPAEKMYDKFISKYNGRIVGIKTKEIKLIDGELYDLKLYEIMREDYTKNFK